ncbi:conditioned medium-induced protein 4 [Natrinema longum]|uniref:Conditioned medium-induced protein 4 n=1 Tax=Natrinema longum TaxID=370324 RepID=A0A8A2UCR3_9EURY|nr:conditioned medium-induced protein 4 [Natrinema longum]MBZ6495678.1 conditioned medium-induced protein 4 [Natrinema longum]QSW86364.1 conditioned medium-induced protein 4 [Natrinema longum]
MNEKTEELRDIFTDVTDGEETITESQEDTRGSLERDERSDAERLESVVQQMRERYAFETPLSDEELIAVARGFYDDRSDEALADELGVDAEDVFEARLALHLVGDDDADEVDLAAIRDREEDDATLAAEYDVSEARIRRYRRVAAAEDQSRTANDRYRDEFDSILADADITERMTTDVREDGLEDATEGMETEVDF